MIKVVTLLVSIALVQTAEQTPQLTLEQQAALRCSAAFAVIAHGQDNGNADALRYPPIADRGREFMVLSMAKLMDETGLGRDAVSQLLSAEAQQLADSGNFAEVMPACLLLLENAGI